MIKASAGLDLSSFNSYLNSCQQILQQKLGGYKKTDMLDEAEINSYPRLQSLQPPRHIITLESLVNPADIGAQVERVIEGRVLWEHTCAGEATRLGLGAKYLVVPPKHLTPQALGRDADLGRPLTVQPQQLTPLSLGQRHMLQLSWNLWRMAVSLDIEPRQVLSRQYLLIIVNQHSSDDIIDDFIKAAFYGFKRQRVFFMIQRSFPGFAVDDAGQWYWDENSPRRLHNHGQMIMQTTMDNQLFHLDDSNERHYLSWNDYYDLLKQMTDKVSFNIEDLDYLLNPIDMQGLAACYKLGQQGYQMVMEVVLNDPEAPIKGGACCYDPVLGHAVMIESFQLKNVAPEQIIYLNKNVNHYPFPDQAMSILRAQGLNMPVTVQEKYVYFQPVQGDINFLVKTAFVRRSDIKPIRSWKSGRHTPEALEFMLQQDQQPGFLSWAHELTGLL